MSKALLLGAGFSADLGMPLVSDFTNLYFKKVSNFKESLNVQKNAHPYGSEIKLREDAFDKIIELHEDLSSKMDYENFQTKKEQIISFKQREMALAKYDLVRIWNNYRLEEKQKGISKKVADSEFLTTYNTSLLYSKIFNVLGKSVLELCIDGKHY